MRSAQNVERGAEMEQLPVACSESVACCSNEAILSTVSGVTGRRGS